MLEVTEASKNMYLDTFKTYVKRDGVLEFLDWLESTQFFTQPASTKFHLAYEGGLCGHSLNVFSRLVYLHDSEHFTLKNASVNYSMDTITLVSLGHDICKYDIYYPEVEEVRNYDQQAVLATKNRGIPMVGKDSKGAYVVVTKPKFAFNDPWPYGHGEKSVDLLSRFIKLTDEEKLAIRWHMGAFGPEDKRTISNVFNMSPLAVLLHLADMQASYLDEAKW